MFWVRLFEILFLIVIPAVQAVLKYLGIGAVVYLGVSFAIGTLFDFIKFGLQGVPVQMLSILGLLKFDLAINIYISALTTYLIIKGLDKATDRKKSFILKA